MRNIIFNYSIRDVDKKNLILIGICAQRISVTKGEDDFEEEAFSALRDINKDFLDDPAELFKALKGLDEFTITTIVDTVKNFSTVNQIKDSDFEFDVAFSFAGEDREYVESVALELREKGVKVFYDSFEQTSLWGKNLYQYLSDIYKNKAKFCIIFISCHYKKKLWTNHELESAQARAFRENREYILPARFDNTEIPGLHETVGYIDLGTVTPDYFAGIIYEKLTI